MEIKIFHIKNIFAFGVIFWITVTLMITYGIYFFISKTEKNKFDFVNQNGLIVDATPIQFRQISLTQIRMLFLVEYPNEQKGQEFVLTRVTTQWAADVVAKKKKVKLKAHPNHDIAFVLDSIP